MLMADAFSIFLLHLAALIIIPGCWVLYSALFPDALDRGQERLRRMPWRTFFLGLGIPSNHNKTGRPRWAPCFFLNIGLVEVRDCP